MSYGSIKKKNLNFSHFEERKHHDMDEIARQYIN